MSKIKISRKTKDILRSRISKEEKVLLITRQTYWRHGLPLFLILPLCFIGIILAFIFGISDLFGGAFSLVGLSLVIIFAVLILWSIVAKLRSMHFIMVITSDKLLIHFDANITIELDYRKLDTVMVKQRFFAKLFGYGSLTIINKAANTGMMIDLSAIYNNKVIEYIPKPYVVARRIRHMINVKQSAS